MKKVINVDFLFLDLSVCTRCQDTGESLETSLESMSGILSDKGYEVKLNKVHIQTEEDAIKWRFESSPTIRVNGNDIAMEVKESYCSTCSSLTDDASVDCRVWIYKGEEFSSPPKEMLSDAVLSAIGEKDEFVLSDNLVGYFSKKDKLCASVEKAESCGCDC